MKTFLASLFAVLFAGASIAAAQGNPLWLRYPAISPDGKTWTVKLRKGSKWSNGDPFTSDDIMFWYKDVIQNKDLTPSAPGWMKNKDGSTVEVKQVDPVTVQWNYADPHTTFLFELANADYGDKNVPAFLPKRARAAAADGAGSCSGVDSAAWKPFESSSRTACNAATSTSGRSPKAPASNGPETAS